MCGVASVRLLAGSLSSGDVGLEMAGWLRHRGPDAIGSWSDGHSVSLGHTRLAIIDLAGSEQPMLGADARSTTPAPAVRSSTSTANCGVICRLTRFRTDGDTEVLLAP